MTRILAVLLLLIASPVFASTPGSWDVGQQPISYPVIGSNNVYVEQLGDGSNAHGGLPPAFASQMADIPAPVIDTRQITEGAGVGDTTGADESKFRFTLFGSHVLADDPLRNYCQRGASHLHEFMGSDRSGACSTFAQLRNDANTDFAAGKRTTTNPGKNLNASAYWHPLMIDCGADGNGPLHDGQCRAMKVRVVALYYEVNSDQCGTVTSCLATEASTYVDFPMGFGYVNVSNMDDPWRLKLQNAIAQANAANAAAGSSAVYQLETGANGSNGYGFISWDCRDPATQAIRSSSSGTANSPPNIDDLTCNAGDILTATSVGAGCWDGKNIYSPSGYDHVTPQIKVSGVRDTVGGPLTNHTDVCPKNWYKIPRLVNKPQWILPHAISGSVPNDSPFLSSDAAFQATSRAQASTCVGSTCAPAGASTFVCKAGCSFHFDYMQSWMKKYLRRAFRHCLGVPWTDTSETGLDADQTPVVTACNDNTLSDNGVTESKLTRGTSPLDSEVNGDAISDFYPMPVPKGHMGPASIIGMNDNMPMPANDGALAGVAPVSFNLRQVGHR